MSSSREIQVSIELALIPLGSFWVTYNSLLATAKFVNEMRDRVLVGHTEGVMLTLAHRRALVWDWVLSMSAAVGGAAFFAIVIWWTAGLLAASGVSQVALIIRFVSVFPAFCGFLYLCCGVSDFRLMRKVLRQESDLLETCDDSA